MAERGIFNRAPPYRVFFMPCETEITVPRAHI